MSIDFSKAPAAATHYSKNRLPNSQEIEEVLDWYCKMGSRFYYYDDLDNNLWKKCSLGKPATIVYEILLEKEWDGIGYPPVGTECEFSSFKNPGWERGIVRYLSDVTIVIGFAESKEEIVKHPQTLMFRPIRTLEQIAAEERLKEIDKIVKDGNCCPEQAVRIYDAGYRKMENK